MRAILVVLSAAAVAFGSVVRDEAKPKETSLQQDSIRAKRSYDKWLDIIHQYGRRGEGLTPYQPFPVDLPVVGKDGKQSTLPLLVLPFPVPVPDRRQECSANNARGDSQNDYRYKEDKYDSREDSNRYRGDSRNRNEDRRYKEDDYTKYRDDRYRQDQNRYSDGKAKEDRYRFKEDDFGHTDYDVRFGGGKFGSTKSYDSFDRGTSASVSSDYLIESFKRQQPTAPELPPALIGYAPEIVPPSSISISKPQQYSAPSDFKYSPSSFSSSEDRKYLPPVRGAPPIRDEVPPAPSPPRFDRSMKLRGFLTVHRSDYTEPYTALYDARTGAARVDYHDGGTTTYRSVMSDRRIKRAVISTDRTGEKDVVVCGISSPSRPAPEDQLPPALPDTEGFSFAGTKEEFGVTAEVWKKDLRGRPGELGAARGESLDFHHELMVHRRGDGFHVPLRYKVAVDSTVLGPNCDGYEHVYSEAQEQEHSDKQFAFNEDRECDTKEEMDTRNPEHMARLEPLREFTMPSRDPRHDAAFDSFVKEFGHTYSDEKETAMRKNLLIQHSRFISSCNRQSATFSLGVNFLSDRLNEELEQILGVSFSSDAENNTLNFPLGEERLRYAEDKLPKTFDWRARGGVTPVKFQGSCASCWAFAVVGSVEGALFIKTKRLVELSEQCLVDCGKSHKANGCKGTWPVHAFNYVKDRGLPARDEYAPYAAKVESCKAPPTPPVTHIEGGVDVPPNNIEAMKVVIRRFAPTVVVVDAMPKSFILYKKGVLRDDRCIKGPKKKLNHAVVAVGWGEERGEPHFILKNSWSAAWGEGGFIRVHAPTNTCGHLTTPSYARLRKSNIDRLPAGAGGAEDAASARDADSSEDYDDLR